MRSRSWPCHSGPSSAYSCRRTSRTLGRPIAHAPGEYLRLGLICYLLELIEGFPDQHSGAMRSFCGLKLQVVGLFCGSRSNEGTTLARQQIMSEP